MAPLLRPKYWNLIRGATAVAGFFTSEAGRQNMWLSRNEAPNTHDQVTHRFIYNEPMVARQLHMPWVFALKRWNDALKILEQPVSLVPALLVRGTEDDVVDGEYNAIRYKQLLPQLDVRVIAGAKHGLLYESETYGALVRQRVAAFLREP